MGATVLFTGDGLAMIVDLVLDTATQILNSLLGPWYLELLQLSLRRIFSRSFDFELFVERSNVDDDDEGDDEEEDGRDKVAELTEAVTVSFCFRLLHKLFSFDVVTKLLLLASLSFDLLLLGKLNWSIR